MYDKRDFNTHEYIDPFDEVFDYWMRVEHLGRYLFARDSIESGSTILDIACSNGYGTKILSEVGSSVVGADISYDFIKLACNTNAKDNITYKVIDLDNDSIDEKFDYIVCYETLEHVVDPNLALGNLYNALNDDGILFLSVPNKVFEEIVDGKSIDCYHLHTFEYKELLKLFYDNKFRVIKVLGQSMTNKIVNNKIPEVDRTDIYYDALNVGYPNDEDIDNTYSYIFVLNKMVK